MNNFNISTNVYLGRDSLGVLEELEDRNVLIVCDSFMRSSGILDKVEARLGKCTVHVFNDVVPDPPTEVVAEGIRCLMECRADVMIALGGGSPIDAAKAIRELASRLGIARIELCYAIPTTSGTGSEVTRFAVITDAAEGIKYPLVDDSLQPMVAILDPELVRSVPPAVTADTGMDALTHALEAYVSTEANDFTDALAEKAVTLIMKFLPEAYARGDDMLAREKVHNAACLAGMAFNRAGLGISHSLAHAIGGKFHLSHGRSNAMVITGVIELNARPDGGEETVAARKYQRLAKLIGLPCSTVPLAVNSLVRRIDEMKRHFRMPADLAAAGISREDIAAERDDIIEAALADTCTGTNPVRVTEHDMSRMMDRISGR